MKPKLVDGKITLEFSKHERDCLRKACELMMTVASIQPVAQPFHDAAAEAAHGLDELLGMRAGDDVAPNDE